MTADNNKLLVFQKIKHWFLRNNIHNQWGKIEATPINAVGKLGIQLTEFLGSSGCITRQFLNSSNECNGDLFK